MPAISSAQNWRSSRVTLHLSSFFGVAGASLHFSPFRFNYVIYRPLGPFAFVTTILGLGNLWNLFKRKLLSFYEIVPFDHWLFLIFQRLTDLSVPLRLKVQVLNNIETYLQVRFLLHLCLYFLFLPALFSFKKTLYLVFAGRINLNDQGRSTVI